MRAKDAHKPAHVAVAHIGHPSAKTRPSRKPPPRVAVTSLELHPEDDETDEEFQRA